MSLINDALKRATQAQPATPEAETPMQPVDQPRSAGLPIYFTYGRRHSRLGNPVAKP